MLKIGIVGFGRMGRRHYAKYQGLPDAQVTAIADVASDAIDRLADDRVTRYTNAGKMIEGARVDVVDVCAPLETHARIAIAALENGAHVICEKPIASTVKDARSMLSAAQRAGRLLFVAQVVRYWPEYVRLADFIRTGKFGRLLSLSMSRYRSRPGWARDGAWSSCLDLMIHDLDYVCHVLGTPGEVSIATISGVDNKSEISVAQVPVGRIHIDLRAVKRDGMDMFRSTFEAEFATASVWYDSEAHNGRLKVFQAGESYLTRFDQWWDPYEAELKDFIETIQVGSGYAGNGPGAAVAVLGVLDRAGRL